MTPESVIPVVVDAPQHAGLGATLDYLAAAPLPPGTLVQVPLGRRQVTGIVWPRRVGEPAGAAQLRPVQQALLSLPPLGPAWMQLVEFCAAYYQRSIGEVALSVLPPELRKLDDARMGKRLERLRRPAPAALPAAAQAQLPPLTDEQQAA